MRILMISCFLMITTLHLYAWQEDAMSFQDQMEVRIIRVEAVVTGKGGERIQGLTQDDFNLLVDGQPAQPAYFREVNDLIYDGSVENLADDASVDPAEDPAAHEGVSYLVFFDDYFTKRRYRQSLIDRIESQLDIMRPQDEMALVRFDGSRLELLNRWTQSQDALRQSLRELRRTKPAELRRQARLSTPSQNMSFIKDTDDYFAAVQILSGQIKEAVDAAAISMRSVPDPMGRKVMLLATTGWPHRLNRDVENAATILSLENRFLGQDLLSPLTDTANLLSYTIYPMQVDTAPSASSAEFDSSTPDFDPFGSDFEANYESLSLLAESTGGKLIHNAGVKRTPFEDVAADTVSYYVLAFYVPEDVDPGKRHAIDVSVKNDDWEVRHRKHYKVQTKGEENRMEMEAALLLNEYRQDMSIHLAAPDRNWTSMKQTFWLKIPADQLIIRKTDDGQFQADVDLRIMVEDERGGRSNLSEMPISFKVKERPEPGKFFVYNATLKLRKTKHTLVFAVTDRNGDASLMLHVPYDPKMFKESEG
jgi:VWFA-related protein